MPSFEDLINDPKELKRILDNYIFIDGNDIKNYNDFDDAFRKGFNSPKGKNTKLDSDVIIKFFETNETKKRIKENTTKEEFEKAYGDGHTVIYTAPRDKHVEKISIPKIKAVGYTNRAGKTAKAYERTKPRAFTKAEIKFIEVRKKRGDKPKQISQDFNKHFEPRTESSIKTKSYRI